MDLYSPIFKIIKIDGNETDIPVRIPFPKEKNMTTPINLHFPHVCELTYSSDSENSSIFDYYVDKPKCCKNLMVDFENEWDIQNTEIFKNMYGGLVKNLMVDFENEWDIQNTEIFKNIYGDSVRNLLGIFDKEYENKKIFQEMMEFKEILFMEAEDVPAPEEEPKSQDKFENFYNFYKEEEEETQIKDRNYCCNIS